ncbi:MAG: HAD-IA family hydrolase [Lachnospiraceae bacterium]|nr:HAD-IA family hydrolase [Lachnospiraceae bacterium]
MKYKCLIFDHDDTVVNSTATIHWPCFVEFLKEYFPDKECSLENYFLKNFHPGFIEMCKEEYGLTDADLDVEVRFWQDYVKNHIPKAYPGVREIMERQRKEGGLLAVISHSFDFNILRDYEANGLPKPDAVYGWEIPPESRKPKPWAIFEIMRRFDLSPSDILVIDDLKPGFDMARAAGVDFAAAGWAYDVPEIETFMRENCRYYMKTVEDLSAFLVTGDRSR